MLAIGLIGLVITLAAWNGLGWGVKFHLDPAVAAVMISGAICSEIIAAWIAPRLADNVQAKAWARVAANAFIICVFATANTIGSHNAWQQFAGQSEVRAWEATVAPWDASRRALQARLDTKEGLVLVLQQQVTELPVPDASTITSRQRAAFEFYELQLNFRQRRIGKLETERDQILREIEALGPRPSRPTPQYLWAYLVFALLEIVKVIGFWSINLKIHKPGGPPFWLEIIKLVNPGRALALMRHHPHLRKSAQKKTP